MGIGESDLTEVTTPRGSVKAQAWITGVRPGVLFLPIHYGYWDTGGGFGPAPAPTTTASAPVGDVGFRAAGDHTALADHSIYHLGQDLAEWSRQHVREIVEIAGDYGQKLDREPKSELGTARRLRERGSEMLGRKGFPELALLHDLREIYTKACGVSADWEMLAQAARASSTWICWPWSRAATRTPCGT